LNLGDRCFVAVSDDIGSAKVAGNVDANWVATEEEDAIGSQSSRCQHAAQANRAISNYSNGTARLNVGRHSSVMSGCHHVCERQNGFEQRVIIFDRFGQNDERAIRKGRSHRFTLPTVICSSPEVTVDARGL